jgi:catechol 2,3-dioxygenase-like lactoylglutathione lyase family enzyme
MWIAIRNQLIGISFRLNMRRIWLLRWLAGLVRPQIGAVDHITIPVHDLAAAQRFYCDFLGASYFMRVDDDTFRRFGRPPAARNGEGAHHISVFLGGKTRVDLFLQHTGQPPPTEGHPHFAFHVPARQLLKWKTKFEAKGIPTEGPLQLGPPGQASLYFNDPFGNHLEFTCFGFSKNVAIRPPVPERLLWREPQPS